MQPFFADSRIRCAALIAAACAVLGLVGCATRPTSPPLAESVKQAEAAYHHLPASLPAYNVAVADMGAALAGDDGEKLTTSLQEVGVAVELPQIPLPLKDVQIAAPTEPSTPRSAGAPVVLEYDTSATPLYPPEGLFVDATAVYRSANGQPRFSLLTSQTTVRLDGRTYPLAANHAAAGDMLRQRATRLAKSGFISMIRPLSAARKPQLYLLDPYDPQKIPLIMVHGLQSTPVAFATLVNALRADPEIRAHYQIWQFYYPSGTPVLANAEALRDSLTRTLKVLDPQDRNPASHHIVVVGHSMGGVISHSLVSSSGNDLWASIFRVPPDKLKGDPQAIAALHDILVFPRNPRVTRVIFVAAPHRGSPMADSFIGVTGNLLTRVAPLMERGFGSLARENPESTTPEAADFYKRGRFSAVRTLSPKSPALVALSKRPITVPYHSIIAQTHEGPKEQGNDGVVPYWSSHLEGANSETIIRGSHNIISNPEAIREIIRILHLELDTRS